jgi:sugar lactone lactonase YvrE
MIRHFFKRQGAFRRNTLLIALMFTATCGRGQSYAFTTLAGTPGFGYADGNGTITRFGHPQDLAADSSGNIYVSDYPNYVIRKVSPNGDVTTLAGMAGVTGYVDDVGSAARFSLTFGIVFDPSGSLIVADTGNNTIRRVRLDGRVTTIAGVPQTRGYLDGPAAIARFSGPEGMDIDASGYIWVADTANHVIRRIDPFGTVSTVAGSPGVSGTADGVGTAARFNFPSDIVVASGYLLVADSLNHAIRKVTADGTVTTFAGLAGTSGAVDGTGAAARFHTPTRLDIDSAGSIYVADRDNGSIRRVTSAGVVTTIAGTLNTIGFQDGISSTARFSSPTGVALDRSGNIWIADGNNSAIRRMSAGSITTVAGFSGIGFADGMRNLAGFFMPIGVAADSNGNVYVADNYNQTIRKILPDGTVSTVAGTARARGSADGGLGTAHFRFPHSVAVDTGGNLYVADNDNNTIRKIDTAGVVSTLAGAAGISGTTDGAGSTARFNGPEQVAVDRSGNVFVADCYNHAIRRITPQGVVSTYAGQPGLSGTADGAVSDAKFNFPTGVAVDGDNNVYVADSFSHVIRKISSAGIVSTMAGVSGSAADLDGRGASARFTYPYYLAVDSAGKLFVTEQITNVVRTVAPDGTVTTIGGSGNLGYVDSVGSSARFYGTGGIAVDSLGNIYVADTNNNVIRRAGLVGPSNPPSAIKNLSVRANVAAGDRLIVGFTMNGPKNALIRAVGPGLAPFLSGITLAANPRLELYNGAALAASNDDWGGTSSLTNANASVGAFPLGTLDAALLAPVDGGRSAHILTTGAGLGLVEVYDAGPSGSLARLTNVSARYQVGTGSDTLVAGFVIQGSGPKTVLIRGSGPSLRSLFGVGDAMSDPLIKLFNSQQQVIATNDNWDPRLAAAAQQVGAFDLVTGTKDAVLMIALMPGAYSAELSGADGGTGNGLIEVYEVGN